MKRAAARHLVRSALDRTTNRDDLLELLIGPVQLDAILDALPLDLEPDELSPPDQLDCSTNVDPSTGGGILLYSLGRSDGPRVYVKGCGSFRADQRFAEELRGAYNGRRRQPKWTLDEASGVLYDNRGSVDVFALTRHPLACALLRRLVRDANGGAATGERA